MTMSSDDSSDVNHDENTENEFVTVEATASQKQRKLCEHGKGYNRCLIEPCNGRGLCPHKRDKPYCVDCGGSQLCGHKRIRTRCKDCDPTIATQLCTHGRIKYRCKDFVCGGGSQLCVPHQKVKYSCVDCGNGVCVHNQSKSRCRDCNSKNYCTHGKWKYRCPDNACGGSQICVHKRQKHSCKECGGKNVCPHMLLRSRCVDCATPQRICLHRQFKSSCKEGCNRLCLHSVKKYRCPDCSIATNSLINQLAIIREESAKNAIMEEKYRTVAVMLAEGLDASLISKLTKVPIEKIETIQRQNEERERENNPSTDELNLDMNF